MQSLEKEATGTVDGKHPQVGPALQPWFARRERVTDGGEHDLDTEAQDTVGEKSPHPITVRLRGRGAHP